MTTDPEVPSAVPRRRRFIAEAAVVVALLVLYASLSLSAVRRKAATFDELYHIGSGYGRWQTGDFQLSPENGLPQEWAALALLHGPWTFPSLDDPPWSQQLATLVGRHFVFESGNDADAILFRTRAMSVVFALALGFLVYAWSRRLFGPEGGLFSLLLFAASPTFLAHGPLVTADAAATLFFLASIGAVWRVLHRVTPLSILLCALALSGLFCSKMSALLILPAGALLASFRLAVGPPLIVAFRGREIVVAARVRQAGVVAGVGLVQLLLVFTAVWGFYGFRYAAIREGRPGGGYEYAQMWPVYLEKPGALMAGVAVARSHHLLPEPFLFSLATTAAFGGGRVSFLNGERSTEGSVLFFPYAWLVKTEPALFLALIAACAAALALARSRRDDRWPRAYAVSPLLLFLALYWAFALSSHLNIGHRHLLPTYPVLYVIAGAAAAWAWTSTRGGRAAIALCALLAIGDAFRVWPNYLSYVNVLGGGPRNGYRHLVDSSLDWGQDLKELALWLHERGKPGPGRPVYLSYFGSAVPEYYGMRTVTLASFFPREYPETVVALRGGTYCISATMLQAVYFKLNAYRSAWGKTQEECYQQVLAGQKRIEALRGNEPAIEDVMRPYGVTSAVDFRRLFEESRLARLCAVLRHREPDAEIGYSIMVYELGDDDVERALSGPPPYE